MKLAFVIVGFALLQLIGGRAKAGDQALAQKLIGEWEGPRHIRAYYPDGSFTLDPRPGDRPLGTWKLKGYQLITQFAEEPTPMIEHIIKITDSEMVSIYDGTRYTYKRVAHP